VLRPVSSQPPAAVPPAELDKQPIAALLLDASRGPAGPLARYKLIGGAVVRPLRQALRIGGCRRAKCAPELVLRPGPTHRMRSS